MRERVKPPTDESTSPVFPPPTTRTSRQVSTTRRSHRPGSAAESPRTIQPDEERAFVESILAVASKHDRQVFRVRLVGMPVTN